MPIALDNPLWHYSVSAYAYEPLQQRLLHLQDLHHCNINCLLLMGWLAQQRLHLVPHQWQQLVQQLSPWRKLTETWRAQRVALKPAAQVSQQTDRLRQQVKRAELLSEQYQLAIMHQFVVTEAKIGALSWREMLKTVGLSQYQTDLGRQFEQASPLSGNGEAE